MSFSYGRRLMGAPIDRLFAAYLLVAAAALAFTHRPSSWPVLLAVHVIAAAVLWPAAAGGAAADAAVGPGRDAQTRRPRGDGEPDGGWRRGVRAAADWAPLLLVPVLYTELAVLNRAVHGGRYFDHVVMGWERALFGGMPSTEWALAMPSRWLSEPLHFAYLSYYFIIFVPPLVLFLRGRQEAFRTGVFILMLSFFAHYLFFIYFPVQGPRYLFPPPAADTFDAFFQQLSHRVLEAGSAQGAAFPSSHVGVSVTQTLVMRRLMPRLTVPLAVLTAGLALGAVYGGFHYAIDAVAGALLGAAAYAGGTRLHAALRRSTI